MSDLKVHDAVDSVRATVAILARAVLARTLLATGDVQPALSRLLAAYHLRASEQNHATLEHGLSKANRSEETEYRARRKLLHLEVFLPRILRLELFDIARTNWNPAVPWKGLPTQVYRERLLAGGWKFGPKVRNQSLDGLTREGWLHSSMERWYARALEPREFPEEDVRLLHLSRFLGGLTRTVYQRFEDVDGSFFWALGFIQPPEAASRFVEEYAAWEERWLSEHAVRWGDIQMGQEDQLAIVSSAQLSGLEQAAPVAASAVSLGRELLLATIGADICRRIGGVDLALWTLQRCVAEPMCAAAQENGEDRDAFMREHFGLTWDTARAWMKGPEIEVDEGESLVNGGAPGIAGVQLLNMLVQASPGRLSEQELYRRMRESALPRLSNVQVVNIALRQLEADDQIVRTVERGEIYYASRRQSVTSRIQDRSRMRLALEQRLWALPGLVEQVLEKQPAACVKSTRYVIPRSLLPVFQEEAMRREEALRARYDTMHQTHPGAELLERGFKACVVFMQRCISPVHLKLPEKKYR